MDEPETTVYERQGAALRLVGGTHADISVISGRSLTMVQRYFGGRLDDRSGAKDDIANAIREIGIKEPLHGYDEAQVKSRLEQLLRERKDKNSAQTDLMIEFGFVNPWSGLPEDYGRQLRRTEVEGWHLEKHAIIESTQEIEQIAAMIRFKVIKFGQCAGKHSVHPPCVIEPSLKLNPEREKFLLDFETAIKAVDDVKIVCSASFKDLIRSHKSKQLLSECLEKAEHLGLRIFAVRVGTPVPIHHNPASTQVEEIGQLTLPLIAVTSKKFSRVGIAYPTWVHRGYLADEEDDDR